MRLFIVGQKIGDLYGRDLRDKKYGKITNKFYKDIAEFLVQCPEESVVVNIAVEYGVQMAYAEQVLKLRDNFNDRVKLICYGSIYGATGEFSADEKKEIDDIVDKSDEYYVCDSCDLDGLYIEIMKLSDSIMVVENSHKKQNYILGILKSKANLRNINCIIIDIKESSGNGKLTLEELNMWNELNRFVVVDLETTGFSWDKGSRVTDIGAFRVENERFTYKVEQLINPKIPIPSNIVQITGISDNMVRNQPDISQVMPSLLELFGNDVLIFHNSAFDYNKFLQPICRDVLGKEIDYRVLCTLVTSRTLFPEWESHKLGNVYRNLNGTEPDVHSHRASADAQMTAIVAVLIARYVKQNYESIKNVLERRE